MGQDRVDLCLASQLYYPLYSGAAERFRRCAPGLRDRGIDMRVFTIAPAGEHHNGTACTPARDRLLPVEYVDNTPVQRVQLRSLRTDTGGYGQMLVNYCQQPATRPDVLHLLHLPSIVDLIHLRHACIPMVFSCTLVGEFSTAPWKRTLQRLHRRFPHELVDCLVVSSGAVGNYLRDLGVKNSIVIIPNGVDIQRFQPAPSAEVRNEKRKQLGFEPDAELIVFVGPISPRKRVDVLAEAWGIVARQRPKARLVLVGPRWEETAQGIAPGMLSFEASVHAILANSSAKERVHFTGKVDNVEDYLQTADLFVFPSAREGFGNAIAEALSCGVASILTPFIGLSDELGYAGEHYLIAERTPQALAAAITSLLDDPERRQQLGSRARQWVKERLGLEKTLDRYADLYRELVSYSKRPPKSNQMSVFKSALD
jgi:glycosyltransferase involved in cell wall biosynthesis